MSKIMSMLEKLRVVEKVNDDATDTTKRVNNSTTNHSNSQSNPQKNHVIQEPAQVDVKTSKPTNANDYKIEQEKIKYEKNFSIEEIYSMNRIENSDVNTIFMLGNFINALPENLPYDVRKYSIMNIISASNTDLNVLLSDGKKRLDTLSQFANDYTNTTNDTITKHREEITKLRQLINYYEGQIQIKESMLEEQNNIIKYENQRINNIINFFKKGD